MALRHRMPDFRPSLMSPDDGDKVLLRMSRAKKVEFRSGGDLGEIVQAVSTCKSVAVEAAVGAGKTTLLPYKLASDLNTLVVHVLPNPYLACQISEYCASVGKESVFIEDVTADFPSSGVACVSAAVVVAKWLEAGSAVLPKCVVFHDESHESDAYTYLIKSIVPSLKVVQCYVDATATSEGSGFQRMETKGRVSSHDVPVSRFEEEWDVYEDPAWGVEVLEGHMLIYEDKKEKAENLAAQYRMAGMTVYRFSSGMAMDQFRGAMQQLFDPASPLIVIIADYSFRSGFTFPVARIIDTGKVANVVMKDDRPIRMIRNMYEMESYQAMGRGGRMDGQMTRYYRPDLEFQPYVCDLEAAELDAAALLFRLLGYQVPRQLHSATMAKGNVPRMLVSALRAAAPLAMLKPVQKQPIEEFFTPSGRRSPMLKPGFEFNNNPIDLRHTGMSADTARKHGMGGVRVVPELVPEFISVRDNPPEKTPEDLRADEEWSRRKVAHVPTQSYGPTVESPWADRDKQFMDTDENFQMAAHDPYPKPLQTKNTGEMTSVYDHSERMNQVSDTIRSFVQHQDEVDSIDIGHYYHATGLFTDHNISAAFPDGYVSVCRWMADDHSRSAHMGLRSYDRSVAINALLLRYNTRTMEMRVLTSAIPEAKNRAVGKDLNALRLWATNMSESIVAVTAELTVISRYLLRLSRDFSGLAEMSPMLDMEESGCRKVLREVDKLPSAGIGPPTRLLESMRSQWEVMPIGYSESSSSGDSGHDPYALTGVQMPTTGKGMRAIASPATEVSYRGKGQEFSIRKDGKRRYSFVRRG